MEPGIVKKVKEKEEKGSLWEGKVPNGTADDEGGGDEEGEGDGKKTQENGEDAEDSKDTNSSMMLGLLDEFSKIYADRLQRVEDTAMKSDVKEYLERKVSVLEGWVRDLGEQNAVLVVTVEELEREAATRVALLEDRLANMAATTRQSCLSLRDHQVQVSSLVRDKVGLEKETEDLGGKIQGLEKRNITLMEENDSLHTDLKNLIQLINRARQTGQWDVDDLTFSCISPDQMFEPVISASSCPGFRRSSQSLKDGLPEYLAHPVDDHGFKKGGSSIASSFSNLQECESSTHGGRGSEKDLMIMKLRADVHNLQSAQEQANRQLVERDKQITDLQTQLMEIQEDYTRKSSGSATTRQNYAELYSLNKKSNIEGELSENIDTLVTRLKEVEDECLTLKDRNKNLNDTHKALQDKHRDLHASHVGCSSVITNMQDQLIRAQKDQDELRTVLTAEVAERHDRIVSLGDELKTQEQQHHETKMQLQLKLEVIKELRKELRGLREGHTSPNNSKSDIIPEKDGERCSFKEMKSTESQTDEIYSHTSKMKPLEDESNKLSMNGVFPSTLQDTSTKISKLENEIAEKSVLVRELQNHLAASRQELHLKDETLCKLEQKLDNSRRVGGEKGERMNYLTGQLTSLQWEVGRTHGQAEKLRREVENKTELVQKLESENSSLTQQLNEKSNTLERLQNQLISQSSELDKKKKEVTEQRLTISALQDALVSSKRACDQLRCRLHPDVSGDVMSSSLPSQPQCASSSYSHAHPVDTKSILPDSSGSQRRISNACLENTLTDNNSSQPPLSAVANNNHVLKGSLGDTVNHVSLKDSQKCPALQPVDLYSCASKPESNLLPDVRHVPQCDKEVTCQNASIAFTPDVLSSCSGNSFTMGSSLPVAHNRRDDQQSVSSLNRANLMESEATANMHQIKSESGKVYDV